MKVSYNGADLSNQITMLIGALDEASESISKLSIRFSDIWLALAGYRIVNRRGRNKLVQTAVRSRYTNKVSKVSL